MRGSIPVALLAVAIIAASGCGGQRSGPSLVVTPAVAPVDTPFRVQLRGLHAGERTAITVTGRSRDGKTWRAVLPAQADAEGSVDLRRRYLLALLRPAVPPAGGDYLPWEQDVTVSARAGSATATAHAQRMLRTSSVSVRDERPARVGFYGEWFTPAGAHRHEAILLLGGSGGGLASYLTASMLAAHGYPVLAIAYFGAPALPRRLERIPLEYLRRAVTWMRLRREVDPAHVIAFGVSRGGELALIVAATYPHLIHGAVGYVPSSAANPGIPDTSGPAWTLRGRPVRGDIPVARIDGPVFVAGGGDDELWPSDISVQNIEFARRGRDRRDVAIVYPHAGRGLGYVVPNQPELPTIVASPYGTLHGGGTPQADEAAREDAWPRLLRFLDELGPRQSS